jgi:hypothetical protein
MQLLRLRPRKHLRQPTFTGYTHNGGFAELTTAAPTVNANDGDTYSFEEIRDWLTEAGFTNAAAAGGARTFASGACYEALSN